MRWRWTGAVWIVGAALYLIMIPLLAADGNPRGRPMERAESLMDWIANSVETPINRLADCINGERSPE